MTRLRIKRKHIVRMAIAVGWIGVLLISIWGYSQIANRSPIRRGRVVYDVEEPPKSVQMSAVVTPLEESLWNVGHDGRGVRVVEEYEEYEVQQGDTLWRIAGATLGDPQRYREIIHINGLTDAGLIRPGMVLRLPRSD